MSYMKKIVAASLALLLIMITAFQLKNHQRKQNDRPGLPASNPFSAASKLLYEAPPFDKITDADYKPALEEGIRQQQDEITKIADNTAAPTFANTIEALEKT